eukprot:5006339-Amphidinium_carterae.2
MALRKTVGIIIGRMASVVVSLRSATVALGELAGEVVVRGNPTSSVTGQAYCPWPGRRHKTTGASMRRRRVRRLFASE